MSLEPDLPSASPDSVAVDAVALDAVAAQATEPHAAAHGHHGPFHTHCENCGTKLDGPWCHKCGQHDFEFHRSFRHVVMEALEAFLHFDSSFFRSTMALLFRPGWLTEQFILGKRAAQMPPFRLYLFVAFVFFLVMHFTDSDETHGEGGGQKSSFALTVNGVGMQAGTEVQRMIWAELTRGFRPEDWNDAAKVNALFARMEKQGELIEQRIAAATPEGGTLSREHMQEVVLDTLAEDDAARAAADTASTAPGEPVGLEDQDEEIPAWAATLASRVSDEEKRRQLVEKFFNKIPKVLLVCMPVFALLTRVLFRKSRGFVYLKHLVLALHFHTFLYLWTLVVTAVAWLAALPGWGLEGWLGGLGTLWVIAYVPWMFRRLFANSWPKTIVKAGLLAGAYSFTLVAAFATTALLIFAL